MGDYPLQNVKFLLVISSIIVLILAFIINKTVFKGYTVEEKQKNMSYRIFLALLMLIWGGILITLLLSYRDFL